MIGQFLIVYNSIVEPALVLLLGAFRFMHMRAFIYSICHVYYR